VVKIVFAATHNSGISKSICIISTDFQKVECRVREPTLYIKGRISNFTRPRLLRVFYL
jgi:hypothetical protein